MAYEDTQVVRKLLEDEVDERTALHLVAALGDTYAVKALLGHGSRTNAKDQTGKTALMVAATRGRAGVLRVLLREGASVNEEDNHGLTAIKHAATARKSPYRNEIIDLLKEAGRR